MKFVNRKAQYPGRVKLVKVAGSTLLYDIIPEEGSVTGSYTEGTPLNADTFNTMLDEINDAIAASKLNSIKITDGSNSGTQSIVGSNKDIILRLPSTIKASLNGNATSATSANSVQTSYGGVNIKTVSLSTSYTTVYTAKTYASALVIIAPWSGGAKNSCIFAIAYSNGSNEIDNVTYVNKSGYVNKRWDGANFQVSMSSSDANGVYSVTIIDAHF